MNECVSGYFSYFVQNISSMEEFSILFASGRMIDDLLVVCADGDAAVGALGVSWCLLDLDFPLPFLLLNIAAV